MGLIRGVARTAAIAGTATAVSNRVSRRQANKLGGRRTSKPRMLRLTSGSRRTSSSRLRPGTARRTDRERYAHTASATWAAQGVRSADRGGVRRTEGKDSRQLTDDEHLRRAATSRVAGAVRRRMISRVGERRTTSRKPAFSYRLREPKNMKSSWLRSSLSTG